VSDDEVACMQVDGGAAGYVRIAAALIQATFGEEEGPGTPRPPPHAEANG
jgi:hypothetical protein